MSALPGAGFKTSLVFTQRRRLLLLQSNFFQGFRAQHISRRAVSSANLPVLREMACVCQWLYWQSSDPIADAQAGKRVSARPKDMLYEFGRLCKKLRDVVGWKRLSSHVLWHDNIDEKGLSLLAKVPGDLVPGKICRQGTSFWEQKSCWLKLDTFFVPKYLSSPRRKFTCVYHMCADLTGTPHISNNRL